ncbi:MAG: hypothetical protein ACRD96_17265, partial [Bryobacteraceae bacterium]
MKRRRLIQMGAALPLAGQETPKLALHTAEAVADSRLRFFSATELAALRRLGELLAPAGEGRPGAGEAKAAEFLDFLLSESPPARQKL